MADLSFKVATGLVMAGVGFAVTTLALGRRLVQTSSDFVKASARAYYGAKRFLREQRFGDLRHAGRFRLPDHATSARPTSAVNGVRAPIRRGRRRRRLR